MFQSVYETLSTWHNFLASGGYFSVTGTAIFHLYLTSLDLGACRREGCGSHRGANPLPSLCGLQPALAATSGTPAQPHRAVTDCPPCVTHSTMLMTSWWWDLPSREMLSSVMGTMWGCGWEVSARTSTGAWPPAGRCATDHSPGAQPFSQLLKLCFPFINRCWLWPVTFLSFACLGTGSESVPSPSQEVRLVLLQLFTTSSWRRVMFAAVQAPESPPAPMENWERLHTAPRQLSPQPGMHPTSSRGVLHAHVALICPTNCSSPAGGPSTDLQGSALLFFHLFWTQALQKLNVCHSNVSFRREGF